MHHVVLWSGGKDSTTTIILAHEHNRPIDLILISLVWFDKARGIYAEYPEHIDWIFNTAIPRLNEWGYKVEVLYSEHDYLDNFYHVITKSKHPDHNGKLSGWLIAGMCAMNSEKTAPIKKRKRQLGKDVKEYIGIAVDEPTRLERMHKNPNAVSLLEEYGYTETMAFEKCKEYGLLSPLYEMSSRGGCWFCPNQKISRFAYLKVNRPDLWAELERLSTVENKASDNFKWGKTFEEVSRLGDEYILKQQDAKLQMPIFDLQGDSQRANAPQSGEGLTSTPFKQQ